MVRRMRVGVVDVGGGVREGGGSRGLGVCGGLCCVRVCVCACARMEGKRKIRGNRTSF